MLVKPRHFCKCHCLFICLFSSGQESFSSLSFLSCFLSFHSDWHVLESQAFSSWWVNKRALRVLCHFLVHVAHSVYLQRHAHYSLCSLPVSGPRVSPSLPLDGTHSRQGKSSSRSVEFNVFSSVNSSLMTMSFTLESLPVTPAQSHVISSSPWCQRRSFLKPVLSCVVELWRLVHSVISSSAHLPPLLVCVNARRDRKSRLRLK